MCNTERSTTQEIEALAHAHHDSAANVEHRINHDSVRHDQDVQGSDAPATECPCCDDCAAVCGATGGSTVASASIMVDSVFDGRDRSDDEQRSSPDRPGALNYPGSRVGI